MFFLFNKPEAEKDIRDAASWYESQQSGLGNRFPDDLENLFSYIEINPFLFPEKYRDVRQAPMKKNSFRCPFPGNEKQDQNPFCLQLLPAPDKKEITA